MIIDSGPELVTLLGQPLDAPSVRQLLEELGLSPSPERKSGRTSVTKSAPRHGLEITFQPSKELRDGLAPGQSSECLVLSVIFFRAYRSPLDSGYVGVLPYGLQFTHSRTAAGALLGAPAGSSGRYKNDRWALGSLNLTIDFAEDEQSIALVTVWLPWQPRRGAAVSNARTATSEKD